MAYRTSSYNYFWGLVLGWVLFLSGCSDATVIRQSKPIFLNWISGIHKMKVAVGEVQRRYIVHIPREYDPGREWPIVIVFHGGGGTAKAVMWDTGWTLKADQEGFIAVFPEGTPPDPSKPGDFRRNPQTWNDGSSRSNVRAAERKIPDKEFVDALLNDLRLKFNVDRRRIYATGFSNGASMAFRVGREFSTRVAAIAPVAGADWLIDAKPDRPVPLLYITGTADPLNPVDGGPIRIGKRAYGSKPVVRDMIAQWAKLHGCPTQPQLEDKGSGTQIMTYCNKTGSPSVVFYTLIGHGHHWPGGKISLPTWIAGPKNTTLDATDIIWTFFQKHRLP